MFYSNMDVNGSVFPLAVNITGEGAPSVDTEANVGMLYMDAVSGALYKCTAATDGVYTWVALKTEKTVTLAAGSWLVDATEGYVYRLAFDGVTADPTKSHVFYSVPSNIDANTAMAMEKEVSNCWVRLSKQEDGAVVFKSLNGTQPTIDIDMNILVVGV